MSTPVIPWNPNHTVICPFCSRLSQEYHPAERRGHCSQCDKDWIMARPGEVATALPEFEMKERDRHGR